MRPVLVQHCYECHSADAEAAKGGLLLDSSAATLTGGDSGPAVVPGKPDESPLIEALRYDGLEMPPSGRLSESIVRDFERWIADGAFDPRTDSPQPRPSSAGIDLEQGRLFWAFQPITSPSVPKPRDPVSTSIDAFVAVQREAAGLKAAPKSDPATLVRRLWFDLIGLPPATEELAGAVRLIETDRSGGVAAIVDQLLKSEQFGVHWGRHWLDVARYADSNGGDFNATFHNAWRYRDYVVDAFNRDLPFDRFVREQIAGDLLPADDDQQRARQVIATGFLMLGTKMLSERDKEKLTLDVVDEQISTVGSAFLGMTLGCARCHDHKFDPVPIRDYYALAGIFASTRTLQGESQKYVSTWPKTSLPAAPEHVAAVEAWEATEKQLKSNLKAAEKDLEDLRKNQSADSRFIVDNEAAEVMGYWKPSALTPGFVGAGYIHDDQQDKGRKSVKFTWQPPATARCEVRLSYIPGANRAENVPIRIEHAEGISDVTLDQSKAPSIDRRFTSVGIFSFAADRPAVITVSNAGTKGYVIADAVWFVPVDSENRPVETPATGADDPLLAAKTQSVDELKKQLAAHQKDAPEPLPQAIAVQDIPKPEDCAVCIRGEHRSRGQLVPRGFLQVVSDASAAPPELPQDQSGRRELAEWITSDRNPLTARVIVNRVWAHLMREGIVRSVDNFGSLGERPTHPELLDYLAAEFCLPPDQLTVAGKPGLGWSIKGLIREITLTETYQQRSRHDAGNAAVDPENRLLWRAHRRRLSAEEIRDGLLKISGSLDLSPGGTPVPGAGVLVKSNDANAEGFVPDETQRRSLYLPIIRNELPAVLTAFDFADPDLVVGKRPVTNVPAQALFLLNSPFVMSAAEGTARQVLKDTPRTADQLIDNVCLRLLSRHVLPEELERFSSFLELEGSRAELSAIDPTSEDDKSAEPLVTRLTRLIHTLTASTEFLLLE
ncbi:MAG: DUF1553 domain-containing protein [Planctomycetaceae bacterium]